LAALLAGNEFGTWAAVHMALWSMPTPEHIRAEQALTRRFASIMPFWMVSVLVSCIPALALARRGGAPAFRFSLAGTFCFVAMLAPTVRGNVPINNRTLALSPEGTPPEEWRSQGTLGSAARPTRRPERHRAGPASPGDDQSGESPMSAVSGQPGPYGDRQGSPSCGR
ncbi:MAG: DUF1772 domain-containing protein, partial [Actinomycetota bacterium]|nr:DUF1772 domain-containing protein [Actinomycetota bacterium]